MPQRSFPTTAIRAACSIFHGCITALRTFVTEVDCVEGIFRATSLSMTVIDALKFVMLCLPTVAASAALAQPVRLDCTLRSTIDGSPYDGGRFQQTVVVDFENKTLQFANWTPLPIIKVSEKFVTALGVVFDASPVGGFVMSLSREDGQFMLRGIGPSDDGMSDRQMDGACAWRQF